MRTFNTGKITFKYPDTWEVEKANILSNPDCIATLSKGNDNLINAVMFPTATDLENYKLFMEDSITDDGGIILSSDFLEIADYPAIKLHANMDTEELNFDIHTYVFIKDKIIYIFELRTLDISGKAEIEFKDIISTFEILK